jgi:hypothetical protein
VYGKRAGYTNRNTHILHIHTISSLHTLQCALAWRHTMHMCTSPLSSMRGTDYSYCATAHTHGFREGLPCRLYREAAMALPGSGSSLPPKHPTLRDDHFLRGEAQWVPGGSHTFDGLDHAISSHHLLKACAAKSRGTRHVARPHPVEHALGCEDTG